MMKLHPYAELTHDYSPEEFQRLKDSIKEHGITNKIKLTHDEEILCGRYRYKAAKALKITDDVIRKKYSIKLPKMSDEKLREYAIRDESIRRHMTAGQRRSYLIKMYEGLLVEDDGKPKTGRPKKEDKDDGKVTISEIATKFGEHFPDLSSAFKVKRDAHPEIWDAVVTGKVADSDAAKILKLDEEDQLNCLDAVKTGHANTLSAAKQMLKKVEVPEETEFNLDNDDVIVRAEDFNLPAGNYGAIVVDTSNTDMSFNTLSQNKLYELYDSSCWVFIWSSSENLKKVFDTLIEDWELEYRFTISAEHTTDANRVTGTAKNNIINNVDYIVVATHGRPKLYDDIRLANRYKFVKNNRPKKFYADLDKAIKPRY